MSTSILKRIERKILSDPLNKRIFEFAQKSSGNLFLIGGYIRDLYLGTEKKDRDFVLEGKGAREMARKLAGFLEGSFVDIDKKRDFARVVINGSTIDFSGTMGKNVDEDLKRRDYTINSIAWSPEKGFIDPLNGIDDIKKGIIRAIRKENLKEDPLRLLRAYRIASELKMNIEKETSEMITEFSYLLPAVSGERISSELFRILASPESFRYVVNASDSGILDAIFPELIKTKDISPNSKSHLSVYHHSLETVKSLELLALRLSGWIMDYLSEEIAYGISRFSVLKLGGILHDIGKPLTFSITEGGEYKFIDHEKAGAVLVHKITERLRTTASIAEMLKVLVRDHLRPLQFINSGSSNKRSVLKFFRSLNKYFIDVTVLAMADIQSMSGEGMVKDEDIGTLLEILVEYRDFKKSENENPVLLNGNELMEIMGIGPGSEIGRMLLRLREAQHLGEVRNKKEAVKYVKEMKNKV